MALREPFTVLARSTAASHTSREVTSPRRIRSASAVASQRRYSDCFIMASICYCGARTITDTSLMNSRFASLRQLALTFILTTIVHTPVLAEEAQAEDENADTAGW